MPNYIQDPNDSKKQIPGSPPDNYYDRSSSPATASLVKTPNSIYAVAACDGVGFFFGSSASFAALTDKTDSTNYENFGALPIGTRLDIHPTAWSGSAGDMDNNRIRFIYKGGLDGSGRP